MKTCLARASALSLVAATVASCSNEPQTSQQTLSLAQQNITASAAIGSVAGSVEIDTGGSAVYRVPIAVPPGVAGMEPNIALTYRSEGPNGLVGVGWGLEGMSSIRRCVPNLADDGKRGPITFSDADALCLDGERLILQSGQHLHAGAQYYLRHHRQWRIELAGEPAVGDGHIVARTDDGRILYYGLFERDRRTFGETNYEWWLDRAQDRFGNLIEYTYARQVTLQEVDGEKVEVVVELVPDRILYTGWTDGRQTLTGTRIVDFEYEPRPASDTHERYWYGARQVITRRLKRIETREPAGLVRTYRLDYDSASITGRSRLTSIEECDGAGVCKPPTTFAWEDGIDGYEDIQVPGEQPTESLTTHDMRRSVLLDLDGDTKNELLFVHDFTYLANPIDNSHVWLVWDPDNAFTYPTNVAAQSAAAGASAFEVMSLAYPELSYGVVPTFQQDFGIYAVDFNGDAYDDVLIPVNRSCEQGECDGQDNGATFATDFQVLLSTGDPANLSTYYAGQNDRFYTVVVADLNGDGRHDILACAASALDGYKFGTWKVGLNVNNAGTYGFEFFATDQACSSYDEYLVFDYDADGASELLTIPAYPPAPEGVGSCSYNCGEINTYAVLNQPIADAARQTHYRALEINFSTHSASWHATGLPRDLFQRWRDETCQNAIARHPGDDFGTQQRFGAGVGHDKIIDVNGDGLPDILRFELASGDSIDNIDAIKDNFTLGDPFDDLCGSESDKSFGIRLYVNRGTDFERRAFIWQDHGDPHEAFWKRFVPAQMLDWNADGRADLLFPRIDPATGEVGPWDVLVSDGQSFATQPTPFVWPIHTSFTPSQSWDEALLGIEQPQVRMRARASTTADIDGDTLHDLVFLAANDDETLWPASVDVWRHRGAPPDYVTRITNGLGAVSEIAYAPPSDDDVLRGNTRLVRGRMFASEWREDLGMTGADSTARRAHRHTYLAPAADRGGRGFLGFGGRIVEESLDVPTSPGGSVIAASEYYYDTSFDAQVNDFPFAGKPVDVVTTRFFESDGTPHQRVVHTSTRFEIHQAGVGGSVYSVVPDERTTTEYSLTADACNSMPCTPAELEFKQVLRSSTSSYDWTAYDRPRLVRTVTGDGHELEVERTFIDYPSSWLIGLPTSERVTSTSPDGSRQTRFSSFVNNPVTGARTKKIREPSSATLFLETNYAYSTRGNLTSVAATDKQTTRSATISWTADHYFPSAITNGLGHHVQYITHPGLGVTTHEIDPVGVVASSTFDGFGRPTGGTRKSWLVGPSDGADTTLEYQPPGVASAALRIRERTLGGQDVRTDFDRLGRPIRREWKGYDGTLDVGADVYQTYGYGPRQLLVTESLPAYVGDDPAGYWNFEYDGLGRVLERTRPDGESWRYTYDRLRVDEVDPDGKKRSTIFDQLHQVARVFDDDLTETCLTRGPFGALAVVRTNCGESHPTDGPQPAPFVIEHDPYGRLLSTTDPVGGARAYRWNAFGELTWTRDSNGAVTTFGRDALGREITRMDASGVKTLVWDLAGPARLASMTSSDGTTTSYDYDAFGRPATITTTIDDQDYVTQSSFDGYSRLRELVYPSATASSLSVVYDYDTWGHLRRVRKGEVGPTLWTAMEANPAGQLTFESYGNGALTRRGFDPLTQRIDFIQTTTPLNGSTTIQHETYQWSPAGDLARRDDFVHGQYETFVHDDLHRLLSSEAHKGPFVKTTSQAYDRLGNITYKSNVGSFVYDGALRLESAGSSTFAYDNVGNVIGRDGTDVLTWNPAGKVTSIATPSATIAFEYDATGARSRRVAGNEYTVYVGELYERTTFKLGGGENSERFKVWAAGRVIAEIKRIAAGMLVLDSTYYVHDDQLGSGVVVTDASANVDARAAYDAWGAERQATNWTSAASTTPSVTVGFTGHRARRDAGLIDMRGRMYDSRIGRFISADPYVQTPSDGRSHNRYSYVWNRPLSLTDPSGYFAEGEADAEPDDDVYLADIIYDEDGYADTFIFESYDASPGAGGDLHPGIAEMFDMFDDEPAGGGNGDGPADAELPPFSPMSEAERNALMATMLESANHPDAAPPDCGGGTYGNPDGLVALAPLAVPLSIGAIGAAAVATGFVEYFSVDELDVALLSSAPAAAAVDGPLPIGDVYAVGAVGTVGGRRTFKATAAMLGVLEKAAGVYHFAENAAQKYVGQSGNVVRRLRQHMKSGRLKEGTEVTVTIVDGDKTAREIVEHTTIQDFTGGVPARMSDNVTNKVDPIGPDRQHLLNSRDGP